MSDTGVRKVAAATAPQGPMGQRYLAGGEALAMRLWQAEAGDGDAPHKRGYETVGYVVEGRAELTLAGQTILLEPGDSWLVPADAEHSYKILDDLTAIEATSPPAREDGRDA